MISLANILQQYGQQYYQAFHHHMLPSHKKAIRNIMLCRTHHLGGHKWLCKKCNQIHYSYHSCKNRHCPQCQNEKATQWLDKQKQKLLPVPYFMVTFTLPQELRNLTRSNQKKIYGIFFKTSSQALKELAKDPRFIGGEIGMIGTLQTWTRKMAYHPHIHYIIPSIALSSNGKSLLYPKNNFLIHHKPLAKLFKMKFKSQLQKSSLLEKVPPSAWYKKWVVDVEAVGNASVSLKYLAPYLFRVAISNKNILSCKKERVTFRYKNRETKEYNSITISAMEFIRRFLQHILPKGFQKIRYYGFLTTKNKVKLETIFKLLNFKPKIKKEESKKPFVFHCPNCGCEMVLINSPNRLRGPPLIILFNKAS